MKKIVILLLTIALAAFFLTREVIPDSPDHPKPIRVGINPWPGYEFLFLAEKKGFFKEEGIEVKLVNFSSLEDVMSAFQRNQLDVMCSSFIEVLKAYDNTGVVGKIFYVPDYSSGADVIISNKAKSLKELKGKTIAYEPNTLGAFMLSRAIKHADMQINEINKYGINIVEMESALKSGQVDAVISYEPYASAILRNVEGSKVIFDSSMIPGEIVDTLAAEAKFYKKNKDRLNALSRAFSKAVEYSENHKDEAYAIMAEREGVSVEDFHHAMKSLRILKLSDQKDYLNTPKMHEVLASANMLLLQNGEMKKDAAPVIFFDEK